MTPAARPVPLSEHWSLWPVAVLRGAGMPFNLLDALAVPDLLAMPPGEGRNSAIKEVMDKAIAAIAATESVHEALVWQNPGVADTWLELAAAGDRALPNRAYRHGVLARYLQRYCAKNESIGSFGPVGWIRFTPGSDGIELSGDGGIRRRSVYLESWAVAALAEAWRRDERLFPYLPIRLDPATSFAAGVLRCPRRPPVTCSPLESTLLSAIDGRRNCGEVLACAAGAAEPREARAELHRLRERGVVQVGFAVPHYDHPETLLRRQVEAVADVPLRAELLGRLDAIDAARDAVARSRGPRALRQALRELSATFAEAGCTEVATPRHSLYGRTLAYSDCRRDADVRLGDDLVTALRAPLAILLSSARWLASEIGAAVEQRLLEQYRWLRSRRDVVTLSDLQFAAGEALSPAGPPAAEVLEDFRMRWAEIIPGHSAGEVRLSSEKTRPLAEALFPLSAPRWAAARQHSPDLMLRRQPGGGWQWVLGELHVALNTLENRVFRTQCDDPDELVALTRADMSGGRVVPLYPLASAEAAARTYPPSALDPPRAYRYWSYASDQGHPQQVSSVPGTAIVVTEQQGTLIGTAGTGPSAWAAPVLEFFGDFLTAVAVNLFQLRQPGPRLGRVLLDDVVICRETWSVPLDEVPLPPRKNTDRGHEALRRWAAGLGMPRHVFVRTPAERKPFYVDFSAPLLAGNLVRAVRRALNEPGAGAPALTVVEMLPGPGELWLSDSAERSYTSEFRMVAVDGVPVDRAFRPVTGTAEQR